MRESPSEPVRSFAEAITRCDVDAALAMRDPEVAFREGRATRRQSFAQRDDAVSRLSSPVDSRDRFNLDQVFGAG